jgi:hypothetical protein
MWLDNAKGDRSHAGSGNFAYLFVLARILIVVDAWKKFWGYPAHP